MDWWVVWCGEKATESGRKAERKCTLWSDLVDGRPPPEAPVAGCSC